MDWNVISAVAGVCGTVLTFVSIVVAIRLEREKNKPNQYKQIKVHPQRNTRQLPQRLVESQGRVPHPQESFYEDSPTSVENDDKPHDSSIPYLYISVGLIGACGGVASILIPWLLLQASPELQCLLYPLLITGLLGGVAFALLMDTTFEMEKSTPYYRFPLSAISGVLGGWIGLLAIIVWIGFKMITAELTSYGNNENRQTLEK